MFLDLFPLSYGTKTQNSEDGTRVDIEMFLGEMLVQPRRLVHCKRNWKAMT